MKKTIFALLLCMLTLGANADNFMFKHLEVKDGLSSNQVLDILKDTEGFVWFATASGLNRYDGNGVTIFRGNIDNPTALPDSYVKSIQEDGEGNLWLQTSSGYAIYDPVSETFNRKIQAWMDTRGMDGGVPAFIYVDKRKYLWFAMPGGHCYLYVPSTNTVLQCHSPHPTGEDEVTDICHCTDGVLLVYSDGTLVCLDEQTAQIKWTQQDITLKMNGQKGVFTLFADRSDDVWVYSPFGLWIYSVEQQHWNSHLYHRRWQEEHNMVHAVSQDHQGRIWIGKDQDGIDILNKETGEVVELRNNPADERSLQNNAVMALYQGEDGTMWVGTYKKGVSYYNETIFKFGIEHIGDINCMEEDQEGYVWLGTNDAGVIYWNAITGERRSLVGSRNKEMDAIVCMLKSRDGKLWTGTFWGGLTCYDQGKITRYVHIPGNENSLIHNNVWALAEDRDGLLWIATLGGGLQSFNSQTGKFTTYDVKSTHLCSDVIMSLCVGKENVLWIGTANGLSALSLDTKEVVNREGTLSGEQRFSSQNINQVYEDSRGLLWIATREGLNVYHPKSDALYVLNVEQGLSGHTVTGIVEDDHNSLWVTTSQGVTNVIPSMDVKHGTYDFHCYIYDDKDGLQHCEFNMRSMKKLRNGEILMGGLYGINRFHPDNLKFNKTTPNIIFTQLSLFNEVVEIGQMYDNHVVLDKALNRVEQVVLNYAQNVFTVRFSSDNSILPEKIKYTYKLDGFNDEWLDTTLGEATYTNLGPGIYTLRVKAINGDGYSDGKEALLKIQIRPPFWMSVWAYLLYGVLAVAILLMAHYWILRNERNRYKLQQVKQEAQQIQEVNEMKLKFFTNVSHELRTPLTLIISPLEMLIKEHEADDVLVDKLKMMKRNAVRLLNLVNQLLDIRKSDVSGHHLSLSDGDVVSFIHHLCLSFEALSEKKEVHLTFYTAIRELNMSFDEDKLGKVMMNLLSNAFKFTHGGGRVDVAMGLVKEDRTGEILEIKVADTGIGINDTDKTHIFERFYQVDNPNVDVSGSGVGLNLVRDFVSLHKGTVEVMDNVPTGTIFVVRIPVKRVPIGVDKAETKEVQETEAMQTSALPMKQEVTTKNTNHLPLLLVVDDNDDFLTFMYDCLKERYQVKLATNGREAWELIQECIPDLIICDIMMPEVDGKELCKWVKGDKRTANIPLILLTARQSAECKLEGLTVGADDYITKPFNMDILNLRICKLLALSMKVRQRTHIEPEPSEITITSLDEKLIAQAVKYVEENIERSDLSVEELSRELGMSRVHLYKKLLSISGKTPIEFIRVIRLKRAAQLLRESQQNVSEIAFQVGFNNPKYFTKYFKEEYGMLPSVYQEKVGK